MLHIPEKVIESVRAFIKKDKLIILLLVGIVLIVISFPTKSKKQETNSGNEDGAANEECGRCDSEKYVSNLETRLEEVLAQTEGVGKNEVIITIKNNGRDIVSKTGTQSYSERDEKNVGNIDGKSIEKQKSEEVVYSEGENKKTPYVETCETPEICGVLIVAQGAGNATVRADIIRAASGLFGISVNKVNVLKMEV